MFSEMFLFGALFAARFVLWGNTRPDLSQEIGLLATGILLLSSFFMYRSEIGAAYVSEGLRRGHYPDKAHGNQVVRALVPVSVEAEGSEGLSQLSACLVDLPVGEPAASMRLHQIAFHMRQQI